MKNYFVSSVAVLALVFAAFTMNDQDQGDLKIGSKAPLTDVKMITTDGTELSIKDVALENGVMVMFSSNTCPWVKKWEDRYNSSAELAKKNKIGVIVLNSNEKDRAKIKESLEDMKKIAKDMNYSFPYAVDKDHKLADAFGAGFTPQVYLFNKNMELVYKGAIDDNAGSAKEVKETYLANAINALASGKKIEKTTSKAIGCTIKRMKKPEGA